MPAELDVQWNRFKIQDYTNRPWGNDVHVRRSYDFLHLFRPNCSLRANSRVVANNGVPSPGRHPRTRHGALPAEASLPSAQPTNRWFKAQQGKDSYLGCSKNRRNRRRRVRRRQMPKIWSLAQVLSRYREDEKHAGWPWLQVNHEEESPFQKRSLPRKFNGDRHALPRKLYEWLHWEPWRYQNPLHLHVSGHRWVLLRWL